ncbi:MAG TPA: FAD-dependent oxidoreductase [Candidatus Nanopelagicaceae bacterium]
MDRTEMLDSKANNSLWADSKERFRGKSLDSNLDFDVAIIGGGFSGLWTAFHLNELDPSLRIAIFEAREIGFGASGRNGGWASSEYPVSKKTLTRKIGTTSTERLFSALSQSIDEIGKFAKKYSPNSGFIKSGSLYFARNEGQLRRLRAKPESGEWISKKSLEELIGINGALAGRFNPECATVHPYNLLQGLAKFLNKKRISIFTNSFATRVDGGVLAKSFFISAPVVVQATEVYGKANRSFIPLYSLMVATEPLTKATWSEIGNAERFTFAENSHVINYAQRTIDNRLAIGGRGATSPFGSKLQDSREFNQRVHQRLIDLAKSWFPILENVEFTHKWGGAVAITRDWEPYLQFDRKSGFGKLGGYAGDGVTMSHLAGKIMAHEVLAKDSNLRNLHFVNKRIRNWEPEPIRFIGVNALIYLSTMSDREESLTNRPSKLNRIIEPVILR